MAALATDQRNRLESTVKAARVAAEAGARQAIEALAVDRSRAFESMTAEEKDLRRRLRSHGRQIGDTLNPESGVQTIHRLVREVAYEHWHRMLFARFLAENELLIEPETGVAITLEECADLARGRGSDPWVLAASFAERMLPQIFRTDDPALAVTLPPETRQTLQDLLGKLPSTVFVEDDSLGWTYQFWQSAEKDAVNARAKSGEKITGETLPAVTQLFTEPYMVDFLLHNTIGAWYAGRTLSLVVQEQAQSESALRDAVRINEAGGYDFAFLRFVREGQDAAEDGGREAGAGPWRPAAGTFERWPGSARELTILDPCCGSGHFLVAAFNLLTRVRMQEEGLTREAAARAVIRENLFGLELDPRCTQIAAFNLALAAWKFVGRHIGLPQVQIACSGYAPNSSKEEWLAIAEDGAVVGGMAGKRDLFGSDDTLLTVALRGSLEALYDLFQQAPELGSLIDPSSIGGRGQAEAFQADLAGMEAVLDKVLAREKASGEQRERAVVARGMALAVRILMKKFSLVSTNFPFLGLERQPAALSATLKDEFGPGRRDLATAFMLRSEGLAAAGGVCAAVSPGEWTYSRPQRHFRRALSRRGLPVLLCPLGEDAFTTPLRARPVLTIIGWDSDSDLLRVLDCRSASLSEKPEACRSGKMASHSKAQWLSTPDLALFWIPRLRLPTSASERSQELELGQAQETAFDLSGSSGKSTCAALIGHFCT